MSLVYEKSMLSWLARRTDKFFSNSEPFSPCTINSLEIDAPEKVNGYVECSTDSKLKVIPSETAKTNILKPFQITLHMTEIESPQSQPKTLAESKPAKSSTNKLTRMLSDLAAVVLLQQVALNKTEENSIQSHVQTIPSPTWNLLLDSPEPHNEGEFHAYPMRQSLLHRSDI